MSQFPEKSCILSIVYDIDQNDYHHEPKGKSSLPITIGLVVFVIFCVLMAVIFVPKIKASIEASGVIELILDAESPKTEKPEQAKICFVLKDSDKVSFLQEDVTLPAAPTMAHAVIEALLKGPSKRSGLSTLIPKGTRLIGLTISKNQAFVDFSRQFIADKDTTFLAISQVSQTLKAVYPNLKKTTILVEGELYRPED